MVSLPILITYGRIYQKPPKDVQPFVTVSEELKLSALGCLRGIVRVSEDEEETYDIGYDSSTRSDQVNATNAGIFASNQSVLSLSTFDPREELRKVERLPFLSEIISILLELALNDKNFKIRIEALETLSIYLSALHGRPELASKCLPGIASNVGKIVIQNSTVHHSLLVIATKIMSQIVTLSLSDRPNQELLKQSQPRLEDIVEKAKPRTSESDSNASKQSEQSNQSKRPLDLDRDTTWLKQTANRLAGILGVVVSQRSHKSWQVRMALVEMSESIISHCKQTLPNCISILLTALIYCIDDDYPQVSAAAHKAIDHIAIVLISNLSLQHLLLENFDEILTSLPKILKGPSDARKEDTLRLAAGYITLLSANIRPVLSGSLDSFSTGLLNAIRFAPIDDATLIDDSSASVSYDSLIDRNSSIPGQTKKVFQHLKSSAEIAGLSRFLRLLAQWGDHTQLYSHFLGRLVNDDQQMSSEVMYVLNEFSMGLATREGAQHYPKLSIDSDVFSTTITSKSRAVIKNMIRSYLNFGALEAPTTSEEYRYLKLKNASPSINSETKTIAVDLREIQSNIRSTCIALEGLANAALLLRRDFEPLLIETLYIVIEKLGDRNRSVRETAWAAMHAFGIACGYDVASTKEGGVISLIVDNIDYVVNEVSQRLRYLKDNPKVPLVLIASLKVAGMKVVPFLEDSIHEVMLAIDDTQYDNEFLLEILLNVLDTLLDVLGSNQKEASIIAVEGVEKSSVEDLIAHSNSDGLSVKVSLKMREFALMFNSGNANASENEAQFDTLDDVLSADKYFKDRLKQKEEHNDESEMDEAPPPETQHENTKPKELSLEEALVVSILEKLKYYLSGNNPLLRACVLRSTAKAVPLLAHLPDKLNPLIHSIWPSIIYRLDDPQHYVVLDALNLIDALLNAGKSFLTRRAVDSLVPKFETLIISYHAKGPNTSGKSSAMIPLKSDYHELRHTVKFKILMSTMRVFAILVDNLPNLQSKELRRITDTVWPFLNSQMYPSELQAYAREILLMIGKLDKNNIWLAAQATIGETTFQFRHQKETVFGGTIANLQIPKFYISQKLLYGQAIDFKENVETICKIIFAAET
jgi:hypothetical protein